MRKYIKTNYRGLILYLTILFIFCNFFYGYSQEFDKKSVKNGWSLELNLGQNYPTKGFSSGFYTNNPSKRIFNKNINHYSLTARKMLNNYFGVALSIGQDKINGLSQSNKEVLNNIQIGSSFEGYMNIGKILRFHEFSNTMTFFIHAGVCYSKFETSNREDSISENNYGTILGVSPLLKMNQFLALKLDYSIQNNLSQNLTWDGKINEFSNNLNGVMHSYSLGFIIYLKNNKKHPDWKI